MGGIVSRVFRGAPEHSNCQKCQRSCCICLDTGLELTQRRLLRLEERERRRSRAGSIASRRFLSDVELEEEEEELELEEVLPRTRPASRRSLRRPAAQRPRRPAQPEPEEEEEPAEEEEEQPAPQPRQRPRARATTVRRPAPARRPRRAQPQQEVEPEEEEEEEEPEPAPAPRPARAPQRAQQPRQRAQPRRAQRQPQPQEEPEEEDNGEEEEEEQQQPPRRARPQAPQPPRRQQPAARRRNNPPEQEEPEEEEDPAPEEEQAPARRRQRTQRTRTQQRRRTQRPAEEDLSTGTEELEELEEELGREARLRRLERRLLLEEDHLRGRMLREDELRRQRSCRRRHQQQKQQYQLSLDRRQQREPEPEVVRGPNVRRLVACYELKRSDISETDAQSLQNLFTQDSPLSSKVALFNQTAQSHRESQLSNPFSDAQASRGMARLQISKEEYGKPKAGSLTEYRGKKANIQVYQEMLELCQVIDVDGKPVSKKNPDIKMIYFGELFNIYTHINDKLVGLLLRARKHDLIQFEGECLFQRRDDHVPVYLTKPVAQIRDILVGKQTEIRRSLSPNPQPTNMLP
ncbi:AGAP001515-PB [Anopheles gambiae str. PEST]|uniref:AGAP001515-PB n=1 Tax=Anopheles gambiae TaxID=7165 RepID=F5HMN1_ANOGA|nr:AGAP001515-PB [Anopheles gambiae str. PEST]